MPAARNRNTHRAFIKTLPPLRPFNQCLAIRFSALACLAILNAAPIAQADTPTTQPQFESAQDTIRLSDAQDGSLLFKTDTAGRYLKAPMVKTDVNIKVSGPIIRTTLSQTFENTSNEWVEGVYVFPLPEDAAVDQLRIIVGGRMIEGQIKEKQKAKKIYQQAKREGKKASLVEQERPNIFTASVANIGPHESVAIQIEYQDKAPIKDGAASLIFPMTVAPRFSPKPKTIQIANADGRSLPVILDPVLDRDRISPPLMPAALEPVKYSRLPVTITIELDAGFDLDKIDSPYHPITINRLDDDSAIITLKDGEIPANRDFKLGWSADHNDHPDMQIFKEIKGEHTYLMTMVTPPQSEISSDIPRSARETIFVLDTSGSMNGTSIIQAREALKLGLKTLTPDDTFNVIRFSTSYNPFFAKPLPATAKNINKALGITDSLVAKGGTNMAPALDKAMSYQPDQERLQQIIFITDGAIGNEKALFALLKDRLGDKRLFPVGIGSAPNRYFITRAAKFGRGRARMIGNLDEVASEMGSLFDDLSHPVMVDLTSTLSQHSAAYPIHLPDLYEGDPVVQIAKIPTQALKDSYAFSGKFGAETVNMTFDMSLAETGQGISTLWAREKIASLEESRFDRENAANIDADILKTALDHHIVSRLTSLVAVDVTPSRPVGENLQTQAVPTQLPDGWKFGQFAQAQSQQKAQVAPPPPPPPVIAPSASGVQQVPVPRTASPHIAAMLLGLIMMLLSRLKRGFNPFSRKAKANQNA